MSKVDSTLARGSFFPSKPSSPSVNSAGGVSIQRNAPERAKELSSLTAQDAKVDITEAVKDFAKIKKAVDAAPELDKSQKIADLKAQIASGSYKIDYDGLADKMLSQDF